MTCHASTAATRDAHVPRPRPRQFSWLYVRLELSRELRRPSTLFFCGLMPLLFYILFGAMSGMDQSVGRGNADAVLLLLMAAYGASITAATSATTISFERPLGWTRELRLTPLRPWAYLTTKIVTALVGSVLSIVGLYVVALILGRADMPPWMWLAGAGVALTAGVTFGAIGLMISSLTRGETAIGLVIPILLVCSFLSGMFQIPVSGSFFTTLQRIVPLGGPTNLVCGLFGPNAQFSVAGGLPVGDWRIWVNLVGWILASCVGATLAYARDTKRQ